MRKTFLFAAAGVGLMMALASHDAQAFTPLGGTPVAPSDVTKLSQADVALAGTAGRGADAAAITVRAGAVSGAAVGASAARSAAVGVEFEGKVKVEECPARVPQRGTRDPQSMAASRIGSGRRAPGRDQLPLCLAARAALVPCGCG